MESLTLYLIAIPLAAFLVFVARPVSVLVCLTPFRFPLKEQLVISWGGLRGAVPIVVATYPLLEGASGAKDDLQPRLLRRVYFGPPAGHDHPGGVDVAARFLDSRQGLPLFDRVQPDGGSEE